MFLSLHLIKGINSPLGRRRERGESFELENSGFSERWMELTCPFIFSKLEFQRGNVWYVLQRTIVSLSFLKVPDRVPQSKSFE